MKRRSHGLQLAVTIPTDGLELKLRNDSGIMATLLVTEAGVKFLGSNQKLEPKRRISWSTLEQLNISGLLF